MLVQPDGRIVVSGSESTHAFLERLQADGSPDTSFGNGALQSFDAPADAKGIFVSAVAQSDDGKIIAAGTTFGSSGNQVALIRVLPNGQPDPAWGTNGFLRIPSLTPEPASTRMASRCNRIGESSSRGRDLRELQ